MKNQQSMPQVVAACQAMKQGGFFGFYHTLVETFKSRPSMTYDDFCRRTERCINPLISNEEALFYSVAYEMGHYSIFSKVLDDNLVLEGDKIAIVDYGCGQGLATLATLQKIADQGMRKGKIQVHLIEPSAVALPIAYDRVTAFANALGLDVSISCQNCTLDKVRFPLIDNAFEVLHLMSYILDVGAVQMQLDGICQQILSLPNKGWVIASGINTKGGYKGFNMLSLALTGRTNTVTPYPVKYTTYLPEQGYYTRCSAKAIGMGIVLNRQLVSKVA